MGRKWKMWSENVSDYCFDYLRSGAVWTIITIFLKIEKKTKSVNVIYSQSPLPQTSACRPCHPCVPRWGTCPGTRCPCGDESCHCAAGAPPACPCRLLPVWGGVPGGGGHPGHPAKIHASWVFPSNMSPLPAHHALLWQPPSPLSHASEAERAAAIHHLKREQTYSVRMKSLCLVSSE